MLFLPPYPLLENKEPALKGRHLSCKPEDGLKTCLSRVREGRDGKQQPKELLMAEMRSLKGKLCVVTGTGMGCGRLSKQGRNLG